MAFREVAVIEIREVLRCWLGGQGVRTAGRAGGGGSQDRAPVRRGGAGGRVWSATAANDQLTDELLGAVVAAVRPARAGGHGAAWEALLAEEARIRDWIERDGLQLTNIHGKLARRGDGGAVSDVAPVRGRALRGSAASADGAGRRRRAGGGVPARLRPDGSGPGSGRRAGAGSRTR